MTNLTNPDVKKNWPPNLAYQGSLNFDSNGSKLLDAQQTWKNHWQQVFAHSKKITTKNSYKYDICKEACLLHRKRETTFIGGMDPGIASDNQFCDFLPKMCQTRNLSIGTANCPCRRLSLIKKKAGFIKPWLITAPKTCLKPRFHFSIIHRLKLWLEIWQNNLKIQ